ncbi:MAG: hypothetical protein PHX51_06380 [Clostridia bacterium]|nr:hypothetical protein [Clostridia bacterium]
MRILFCFKNERGNRSFFASDTLNDSNNYNSFAVSVVTELKSSNRDIDIQMVKCIGRIKDDFLIYLVNIEGDNSFDLKECKRIDENSFEGKLICKKLFAYNKRKEKVKSKAAWRAMDVSVFDICMLALSVFIFVASAVCMYLKFADPAVFILSFGIALIQSCSVIAAKLYKRRAFLLNCKYASQVDGTPKEVIISQLCNNKSKLYKDFKVRNFGVDFFMYSEKANKQFIELADRPFSVSKDKIRLCEDTKKCLAEIISSKIDDDKEIYDGKLLGLGCDLTADPNEIMIKHATYNTYVSMDEMIYKNITLATQPTYFFKGSDLAINPATKALKDFTKSPLTNILGVNMLVFLKNPSGCGEFIINVQSMYNDVNVDRCVPSASGTVDEKDLDESRYKQYISDKYICAQDGARESGKMQAAAIDKDGQKRKPKAYTFCDLLKVGMFRELAEESYIERKNLPELENAKFELLGYSRLLSKGGKPDFFALLTIESKDIDELKQRILLHYGASQNKYAGERLLESNRMIFMDERKFFNEDKQNAVFSAQLAYLRELLSDKFAR